MAKNQPAYLWFDSEFTGLDLDNENLLQVALIITDQHLERLTPPEEDINIAVQLPDDATVTPWVLENIPDVVSASRSSEALHVGEVDARLEAHVLKILGPTSSMISKRPILAGNSIHIDRQIIRRLLPQFEQTLHYRMLDVSSWKLGWQHHFEQPGLDKEDAECLTPYLPSTAHVLEAKPHDAYYDVCMSIAEYRFYIKHLSCEVEA